MTLLFDSFWRAVAYCLHPRVMLLSVLPLILLVVLSLGVGYVYWDLALETVRHWLDASTMVDNLSSWLQAMGVGQLQSVLAPLIVIFAVTPLIVVISLLVVALMMTPALTSLVAEKRFPALERCKGGSFLGSLGWSLLSTLLALVALVVSMPLWLVPPLILVLPPLIWGWLTYRVMAFDALAEHASLEERREIFRRHRLSLMAIGVFCGFLGAAPSLIWASGALLAAAFVVLVPLAIWIYAVVFALSSLWFAHFCLSALQQLRVERASRPAPAAEVFDMDLTYATTDHEPVQSLPPSH
nr:EI24 domain-containing protein [uncultured Rhodoferax sp.]